MEKPAVVRFRVRDGRNQNSESDISPRALKFFSSRMDVETEILHDVMHLSFTISADFGEEDEQAIRYHKTFVENLVSASKSFVKN